MESIVYEDSPLAAYLEGEGAEDAYGISSRDKDVQPLSATSPSFAPRGKPHIRPRFRNKIGPSLRVYIPPNKAAALVHNTYTRAINSRLGRVDNARFLERFRYTIVASQLLSVQSYLGQASIGQPKGTKFLPPQPPQYAAFSIAGALVTASLAFGLTWLVHWARVGSSRALRSNRVLILLMTLLGALLFIYAYTRRQWLQYLRQRTISEVTTFVGIAQDFDHVAAGAMTLVQEVELVSRGYRISTPLPPISRLEDGGQTRKCARLRKALRLCLTGVIPRYHQAFRLLKPLTQELDLEKYYDIYDVSDIDISEALTEYSDDEFEDPDSLRVLKIIAARFFIIRKIFLCSLLALDANGEKSDIVRWTAAADEIYGLNVVTEAAENRLHIILNEEQSFSVPPTPKLPLTPNRERCRAQLRKLNSLSTGIRGLQAKLHVLRDESDKNLNDTTDVSELGITLMNQYESIGGDLRALMQEWEEGKAALASNIDRNERRISSMSGMLSPTISLGGLTAVDEGGAADALKSLNGDTRYRSSMELSSSDVEEVFEAIAMPKQRSILSREERIVKMKEERTKRESMKEKAEANTHMLKELESVINMRPRGRITPAGGRITSI